MRFLLDTSTLLWWDVDTDKLSTEAYDTIQSDKTDIYLSYISIWEIQIKNQLGKLELRVPLQQLVQEQITQNNIILLSLTEKHIYGLSQLPYHHRDPFDRLLISQASAEDLTLITKDSHIPKYDITTLW